MSKGEGAGLPRFLNTRGGAPPSWADLGGGGVRGPRRPLFSCIFEKFLTLSLTFGHKCSQNDVKQHHQFLRPPLSGCSGSAPAPPFFSLRCHGWTSVLLPLAQRLCSVFDKFLPGFFHMISQN